MKNEKNLKSLWLSALFALVTTMSFAKAPKAWEVKYAFLYNGKENADRSVNMIYSNGVSYLSASDAKIQDFIDFNQKLSVTVLNYDDVLYKTSTSFDALPQPQFDTKEEKIMGYDCQYAKFSAFSNTIEVWYTTRADAKGGPYKNYIPSPDALVLKVLVNNTYEYQAASIKKIKADAVPAFLAERAEEVTQARLEELMISSRYTVLPVFNDEQVYFDPSIEVAQDEQLAYDRVYHFSKGSVILKRVKLPELWQKGAQAFVKLTLRSNGDAYDRVGSVFVIKNSDKPVSMQDALQKGLTSVPKFVANSGEEYQGIISDDSYETPLELMRFATPFGVNHFNKLREINNYPWEEEVIYKEEVSDLLPAGQDEVTIGVFIGNYDKGGHKVSLELDFYPNASRKSEAKSITIPLFYTVNIMEMSGQNYGSFFNNDTLSVNFKVEQKLDNAQLIYTSTGHGGWGGGDEFNPKLNHIFMNGQPIYSVAPWRTDCATYRLLNPASGNFSNGLSSSDLSRSNWCPGTISTPYFIPLGELEPGSYEIKIAIDQGEREGNSFSHWCISGVLIGEEVN